MVSATQEEQMGLNSPAEPHTEDARNPHWGECVLLVEDDMPTLRLERVILEEAGYFVEGVDSGEAALQLIAEEPPALVILDIGLPGMDGFATCRRIRESSQVPVVMVTGNKSAADQKQGTESGANGYITKPFLTAALVEMIGEIISEAAEYANGGREGSPAEENTSNTDPDTHLDNPLSGPQPASAAETSAPAPDVSEPVGESASLPAGDGAQPEGPQAEGPQPVESQPVENRAVDSALPQHNDNAPTPMDKEEPEDHPTVAAPGVNSQPAQEQQSAAGGPVEDPLPQSGGEPVNETYDELNDGLDDEQDDGLYEGTVRLTVVSSGPVKSLLNFVGELRQNPQLRLLRLIANQRSESMDIWLGLREPLDLITVLGDISEVSQVDALPDSDGDEEERRLSVAVGQ